MLDHIWASFFLEAKALFFFYFVRMTTGWIIQQGCHHQNAQYKQPRWQNTAKSFLTGSYSHDYIVGSRDADILKPSAVPVSVTEPASLFPRFPSPEINERQLTSLGFSRGRGRPKR